MNAQPNRINLLKGLAPQITVYDEIEKKYRTDWFNSTDASPLTDSVFAKTPECRDSAFFRMTAGEARAICFDLGGTHAIDGFRIGVLRQNGVMAFAPSRIMLYLSSDGNGWQHCADATGFETWGKDEVTRIEAKCDTPVTARYAKFIFTVPLHVWVDEIELFEAESSENAVPAVDDGTVDDDFPDRYASTAQLGAKDVMLAYMCREDILPISKEMLLPYVGYIKNGRAADTMFDSFLFLPHVFFLYDYSSGHGVKKPLQKKDWQFYIDTQFAPGVNMDALELAAEETGRQLGKPDLQLTVLMSILYPVAGVTDFGEIDGRRMDFSNTEDRFIALKWLVDEQLKRFEQKRYKHLKLLGYYWFTEEISYLDAPLMELLRRVTDHVRGLGYITTWIPYYHATGYSDWRHLGFDLGCYQPNYAFNQSVPDRRLFDAAKTAKLLGMCIELEMGGTEPWNIERMKKYYAAGALTRYMQDAAHMYYQGSMPGYFYKAFESKDPYLHSVYDDTYKFIKGTFSPEEVTFDINEEDKQNA